MSVETHQSTESRNQAADQQFDQRPHMGWPEVLLQMWRSWKLILLVFIPLAVLGVFLATFLPERYNAGSRIQVILGREYVYEPLVGDAGKGAVLPPDTVVRAEIEKAYSPLLPRRILEGFGMARLYPKAAQAYDEATTPEEKLKIQEATLERITRSFSAIAGPKSPVFRISFTHEDPVTAADVANAFVDEYLKYRAELVVDRDLDALGRQRSEADARLNEVEHQIQGFLLENRIGDFDTEKSAAADREARITNELYQVEASVEEVQGRLRVVERLLQETSPEIELYVDTSSDEQLLQLQIEREQLLARYTTESQPVREIDQRIFNLQQLLRNSEGGSRRRGPNPSYQELQSRMTQQTAELDALRARARQLRRQLSEVKDRQLELIGLQPSYQQLLRQQSVLENATQTLSEREQTEQAKAGLFAETTSSVTVLERAFPPSRGTSFKRPAALAAILFAGFTALMAGLGRALTRRSLSTSQSASKTLGVPVLGSVPAHRQ